MLRSLASVSLSVAAIGAVLTLNACGGIGDIDRTQPDKVKKTTFFNADGTPAEYYFRQTIIDVPATNGTTFIGEQGETERVVFEITETLLYAYRAYGFLENDGEDGAIDGNQGDGYNRPGTGAYHGSPIAAFPIMGHFDVKRAYNPATGEQTNVIVEDYQDRPWYQREYMRVNWAQNVIADFRFGAATVAQMATVGRYVPSEDQNLDEENTNRPIITPEYIDTVTELDVLPEYFDLSEYGYGLLPQCYFYSSIYKDCFGGTIKVRNSFRRVGDNDGYVAQDYDDLRFQKFGYFRTERFRYNDEYGVVEPAAVRLANRHNIWRDAASCYDADADLPYSACSPSQLKPIVYHLNEDFPRQTTELLDVARNNGQEWNRVMREAVRASTGFADEDIPNMFVICENNPVVEGDPAECGPAGTNPQIGDLRYSMYYYVPNFQYAPPLGYGPSAADPLTGEIIQGNAFYYGAAGATIAARTRDAIKLQLGLLTDEDITGGLPATNAVAAAQAASSASRSAKYVGKGLDLQLKAQQMADNLRLDDKMDRVKELIATGQAMHDKRPGRLERLKNSGADEILLTDEMREVFGPHLLEEGLLGSEADAAMAARLFDDDALFRREIERQQRLLTPRAKGCILSAEDVFVDGLLGLVNKVKVKFYDTAAVPPVLKDGFTEDDVYNFILAQTMGDTQLHEIGHTVGLRHNFSGSTDALNYGTDYWELRGLARASGSERPLPEWEIDGNIANNFQVALDSGMRDNQDSTVMDYASTYGTSLNLGLYDLAAIKYAYGDVVEVFNSQDVNADKAELLKAGALHYLYYPEVVSNAPTYEDRISAMYDRGNINFRKVEASGRVEVPYSFCSDEYRDASATCAIWDQGADNFERTVYAANHFRNYALFNQFKRQRVVFGLDVFAYLARVYRYDYTYMLNQYKNWVNDEFIVRDGQQCNFVENGQIVSSNTDRFVANECGLAGFLGTVEAINLFAEVLQAPDVGCYVRLKPGCYDTVAGNGDPNSVPDEADIDLVSSDPGACDAYTPAQPADPDADRRVKLKITDKSPYNHVNLSTSCEGYSVPGDPTVFEEPVELGYARGGARPSNTLYDREEFGYYFYVKPIVIGSWWDKWMAVKALNDPNTDFIGVDAASDPKAFLISMNTLFGDQVNDLVGSAVTENLQRYAPVLENGQPRIVPLLDINTGGSFNREDIDAPLLNPAQQYTFRLLAMFNASYSGQYTDDFEFAESIQVGSAFNTTDVDIPDEIRNDPSRYAELTDPVSGVKWFALNQLRDVEDDPTNATDGFYSTGYQFIREIKDRYYVGGADGQGTQLHDGFNGTFQFFPRNDIEILRIMSTTAGRFGWADVWEGDVQF